VLVTVKARVVRVRPRHDGTFGITLGTGPGFFWFWSKEAPKLGQLVVIERAESKELKVHSGKVTILQGGKMHIEPDRYARRVVFPQWINRVSAVVRRPLYPYQQEGAAWLAGRLMVNKGSILGDDPGLGKTITVLAAVLATKKLPAIIVCPPSVKRNWAKEVMYLKAKLRVAIVSGKHGAIPSAHIIIVNYDILRTRESQFKKLKAKCIIFDEAHLLKEPQPKSKRHRARVASRIAKHIGVVVHLTGTPILNKPQELWRLLHMVDPEEWPEYSIYRKRYCGYPKKLENPGVSVFTSHGQAKHIDELRALVDPCLLRRLKKDVLREQLPPKERRVITIDLEPFDLIHYKAAEKDVVEWLRKVSTDKRARQAARCQAIVKLTMLRRIAAVGKLRKAVGRYITTWFKTKRRPLVVFAYHRKVAEGVRQICKKRGISFVSIRGSDNDEKRQKAVDEFQRGNASLFIAPLKSAGVGINLHRASDVLCLERLWTPKLMDQAEDRCHRIGQTRKVIVTYMDARATVDEHISRVSMSKQIVIDKIVDDATEEHRKLMRQISVETIDDVISKMERGI